MIYILDYLKNKIMNSKDVLFMFGLVIGVTALFLWICRFFIDIPIIYPLSLTILNYILLYFYKKMIK